ncbi:hypothetical protein [Petroclostridium sp. X23]|uniref:hypothetical protein n=1 Tax=Petroclostridium sp. X23 TaxID=3045146 RepID=UPI0024ADF253|nr:hypothetical protein [Petroclostridium sp. X23]WHH59138.1 hypothetical protein QKW49_25690 [Petroclostridium sp. X23]
MEVNLVKRKKVIHLGAWIRSGGDRYMVSICNGVWNCDDKSYAGETSEVTCKRCMKYAREAEGNNGIVNIKPKRKR